MSVSFDADGISQPGRIHFVSPRQVNVQIPWELQGRSSAQMKVTVGGLQSYDRTIPLATHSPGIFEVAGFAAVHDVNFALVNQAHPAVRGQAIQIYMNGLGPVTSQPGSGEPSSGAVPGSPLVFTNASPSVTIGGVPAEVIFSGMTPGVIGLYQINVIPAANTPTGNQRLEVSIGGGAAKASMLPVQ